MQGSVLNAWIKEKVYNSLALSKVFFLMLYHIYYMIHICDTAYMYIIYIHMYDTAYIIYIVYGVCVYYIYIGLILAPLSSSCVFFLLFSGHAV